MLWREAADQASALLASIDPATIPPDELPSALVGMQVVAQASQAKVLALLRRCEALNIPSSLGAAHPVPWLADLLKVSRATVRRLRRLGVVLADAPAIGAAFAAGEITDEQAKMMATTVAMLPPDSERVVLSRGADLGPDELHGVLREVREEVDPTGTQRQDEAEAEAAMKRAESVRRVYVSRLPGENLVYIRGYLDSVAAAAFLAALDALCAPRNRSALGLGLTDAVTDAVTDGVTDGVTDQRTTAQRRHDAICEIGSRIAATGKLPDHGGDRPQATVTVPYQTLMDGLRGIGLLDDGTVLTAAACRLLSCDARILPAVMGGESSPLDLGRSQRLYTGPIRRALNLRDRGCAFPACDRGIAWTVGHHIVHWSNGGTTDLGNAVLVCGPHHRMLHHSEWRVTINPADGLPDFFAPNDDRPRRNHYHRRP